MCEIVSLFFSFDNSHNSKNLRELKWSSEQVIQGYVSEVITDLIVMLGLASKTFYEISDFSEKLIII